MKKIAIVFQIALVSFLFWSSSAQAESILDYGPGEKLGNQWGNVDVQKYVDTLPKDSKKAIEDRTIVTMSGGGARVFRLYKPSSPHYHAESDAILYVLSGKGEYEVADSYICL